jgi:hypothetical protein
MKPAWARHLGINVKIKRKNDEEKHAHVLGVDEVLRHTRWRAHAAAMV